MKIVNGGRDEGDWSLERVIEVSRAIDQIAKPGEEVASFWPGYVFQTGAIPFPGLENDFGLLISERLSPAQRLKYHILSSTEIEDDFAAHTPRIVVLGDQILAATTSDDVLRMQRLADDFRSSLRSHGLCCGTINRENVHLRMLCPKAVTPGLGCVIRRVCSYRWILSRRRVTPPHCVQ